MKNTGRAISTILIAIPVIVALSMVVSAFAGFKVFTVLSGSMEPAIHTGSLIYVKPVDAATLREGDVITFAIADDMTATHRIVEIIRGSEGEGAADAGSNADLQFITKGDANDAADASPVSEENIVGTPVLAIPLLGYAVNWMRNPPGLYITIAVITLLIILSFIPTFKGKDQ